MPISAAKTRWATGSDKCSKYLHSSSALFIWKVLHFARCILHSTGLGGEIISDAWSLGNDSRLRFPANKELSFTFENETQNRLVLDSLLWLGGRKE